MTDTAQQRVSDGESPSTCVTTMHVQRAVDGDPASLGWVIGHLSPLLCAQAKYRLGGLGSEVDAEDLVHGAWVVALPRLGRLSARDGRLTPVLLKYLSTTMMLQIQNLRRRRRRRNPVQVRDGDTQGFSNVAADTAGVVTRVDAADVNRQVRSSIEALDLNDREILVLRGVEQRSSDAVAVALGISRDAVYARYSRALRRLRERLPDSVFDELGEA